MGGSGSVLSYLNSSEDDHDYIIIIHGAVNLRDADWSGQSDPYCQCRIGPTGSSWTEKSVFLNSLEWKSNAIGESLNPEWNMKFAVGGDWLLMASLQSSLDIRGLELEIAVCDEDIMLDDGLGRCIVPIPENVVEASGPVSYPLAGKEGGQGAVNVEFAPATSESFGGETDWKKKVHNCKVLGGGTQSYAWEDLWALHASETGSEVWRKVMQFLYDICPAQSDEEAAGKKHRQSAKYFADLIKFMRCDDQFEFHLQNSQDGGLTNVDLFGHDTLMHISHAGVSESLRQMCPHLQQRTICRGNDAGPLQLSTAFTPMVGRMDDEVHRQVRPLLDKVAREALDEDDMYRSACSFLDEHIANDKALQVPDDLEVWSKMYLYKAVFGMDVDRETAEGLVSLRKQATMLSAIPQRALEISLVRRLLKVERTFKRCFDWSEEVKNRCTNETVNSGGEHLFEVLTFFALREPALYFGLQVGLSVLFGTHSPAPDLVLREEIVPGFVKEVLRYRPFLTAVGFYEGQECTEDKNVLLSLYCANRDPRVWGDDSREFRIRDMELYEQHLLSHADHAVDEHDPSNNRFCAFKGFSTALLRAFFRAFCERQKSFTASQEVRDDIRVTQGVPYVTSWALKVDREEADQEEPQAPL